MDPAVYFAALLMAAALIWVAVEIRRLHADLQPLIDSPIVRTLTVAGA